MAFSRTQKLLVGVAIAAACALAWWVQRPTAGALPAENAPGGRAAKAASQPAATASGRQSAAPKPVPVEVTRVQTMPLSDQAEAVGTLQSRRSVMIRPEVSGRIVQLNFQDGQRARKGQVLVQLDDQLPQAQVLQAQAELSIAQANHTRNQELVGKGFVSQRSLDESFAALQVAQAKLALAQATAARLKVVAPFDGVVGIRKVNVGDYIKDGSDVVNMEDLDAVLLNYRLPERLQPQIRPGQTVGVQLDALPGKNYRAVVQAINPQIDNEGRSVAVQACLNNADGLLRPGMFARVSLALGQQRQALVVPEQAVLADASGTHVFKVVAQQDKPTSQDKTDLMGQKVAVELGWRGQGLVEVVRGLAGGDSIITAGQQRIKSDRAPVKVVDAPGTPSATADAATATPKDDAAQNVGSMASVASGSSPANKTSTNPCALGRGAR